jgi:protein TonB
MKKIGGSVEPPKVLKSIEPQYTRAARDLQYSSKTVVGLIVEENGIPSRVSVVRAAGLGLDEQTLSAVSHYVFAPAVENGKPVRVQLNVEVPFDIIK